MQRTCLKLLLGSAIAVLALTTANRSAFAHGAKGDHSHHVKEQPKAKGHDDHPSPHGGVMKSTAAHRHVELVSRSGGYTLYVYDADLKPLEGAVTGGKLIVVVGKKRVEAPLTVKGSTLMAELEVAAGKQQIVAQLKLDGKAENLKFNRE